ncbi:MAG: small multi-drug export protein [archaeon]
MNPFWLALISVTPFIELRGAIPLGIAAGLDPGLVFMASVVPNILLIPVLFLLLDLVFKHVVFKMPRLGNVIEKQMERARKKAEPYVKKYGFVGLALFVAIPLPLTGAWTGSFGAYVLKMKRAEAIASIAFGVFIAGSIVMLASVGIIGLVI